MFCSPRSAVAAVVLALFTLPGSAKAGQSTYVFQLNRVTASKGELDSLLKADIETSLARRLEESGRLLAELPEDAPDPAKDPKAFKAYREKRNLRAFAVRVEVSQHELVIEDTPDSRGKTVVARLQLRLLGEHIPEASMAFTGDGAATVKMGVGRKVRKRDREVARRDAVDLAIRDALATSLDKLDKSTKANKSGKKR